MTFNVLRWRVTIPPPKVIVIVTRLKIRAWFYRSVAPRIIRRFPRKFLEMSAIYVFSFMVRRVYGQKPKRKYLTRVTVAEVLKYWRTQHGITD